MTRLGFAVIGLQLLVLAVCYLLYLLKHPAPKNTDWEAKWEDEWDEIEKNLSK
jgi:hypothetical protein